MYDFGRGVDFFFAFGEFIVDEMLEAGGEFYFFVERTNFLDRIAQPIQS